MTGEGIKRLARPRFSDVVQCDSRGRMLNMIKSSYDYATIFTLAKKCLADLTFGVKSASMGRAAPSTPRVSDDPKTILPEYSELFTEAKREEILYDFSDLMEATTPEGLASTPQLEWVYTILRGKVYLDQSEEQVRELLAWKPKKRQKR